MAVLDIIQFDVVPGFEFSGTSHYISALQAMG